MISVKIIRGYLLVLGLVSFRIIAETIDTSITADGTPGPYLLGRWFISPASLKASYADSSHDIIPPFTYVEETNGILFSEPIDSGRTLAVRYSTTFYGLQKTYSLFKKTYIDTSDTVHASSGLFSSSISKILTQDNLSVSGYKSIGISLGSQGQMNLEQALDVHIFGEIAPQTELSANLSDQGTSLDGATRELGEIDMVYVSLNNPRYRAIVGDQYIIMPPGGLLYGNKKIKGLSAGYTGEKFSAGGFGAISGGKYAVQNERGRLGFQGPYYLVGNGEADIINPISGTVKVFVGDKNLEEGEDADFVIDYDLGTLTFMPSFPIDDDQFIRIEYEYKSFDYQRMTFGGDLGASSKDSIISVKSAVWYEMDNKHHPIETELDDVTIENLKNAGDTIPLVPNGRRVHPNDVERRNAIYPLYRIDTTDSGQKIYTYEENPSDTQELYLVWFRSVPAGDGDYVADSTKKQVRTVYFYRFDTTGTGNYTSSTPFPAPRRSVIGQTSVSLRPCDWLRLSTNIAGEENDKNLFSNIDDKDNRGSATRSEFILGRKTFNDKAFWLLGNHSFISRRFTQKIITDFNRKSHWDRERDFSTGGELQIWESSAGATFLQDVATEFTCGQYIRNDTVLTHRSANNTRLLFFDKLLMNYTGNLFHHTDMAQTENMHSDNLVLDLDLERMRYGLRFDDEWRFGSADTGRGNVGGGADLSVKPVNLQESVYYSRRMKGDRFLASDDTTNIFTWQQSINHMPLKGWSFSGSSSYQKRSKPHDTLSTLLITASNDVASPRAGFTTHQDYSVTSEKATAFIQVPVYAGEGLGYYSFDTTLSEYMPDRIGGSYFMEEREVYDTAASTRVRKTMLKGNWTFKPPVKKGSGILADITLLGSFNIEEHIKSNTSLGIKSWVPGCFYLSDKADSLISFANGFYRQDLKWRPAHLQGLNAGAYIKPSSRKVRRYNEESLEWGGDFGQSWNRFFAGAKGRILSFRRHEINTQVRDTVQDRYVDLTQKFNVISDFSLFIEETAGWAKKKGGRDTSTPQGSTNAGSNMYFKIRPGCTFQPKERGFAEASYTLSYVDIPGTLDYRMAQGYNGGISHTIEVFIDVMVGKHISIGGNYRGEYNKPLDKNAVFGEGLHVVSLEVKAYL